MRIRVAGITALLCAGALAGTADAQAALRATTNVPSESLQVALQALARARGFQIVYRSGFVNGRQSHGAHGELSVDEALTQILAGTGLTYHYLDGSGVTIVPVADEARSQSAPALATRQGAPPQTSDERSGKEATTPGKVRRSFWGRFRLAEVDRARGAAADDPVAARASGASRAGAGNAGARLQEVVVTATRRVQSIQEVPLAVTALSADAIQERRINSSEDLAAALPGLVNVSNQTSGSFAIRGQGPSFGSAPGSYVYFAEVPMLSIPTNTEPSGIDTRPGTFFDMASVELLKGPQGTLFGRNATGGNILFVPQRPVNRFEGYVQGQLGDYADRALEGALNVPLIDRKLLVRLAGAMETRDGFVTDVGPFFPGKDYENLNYATGRLSVLYLPTDNLEEYLIGRYYESRDNGPAFVEAAISPGAPAGINTLFPSRIADFNQQIAMGPRHVAFDSNVFDTMKYWQFINRLTYRISDHLRIRNILSNANSAESLGLDVDATPNPILNQTNAYRKTPHAEIMTGELQLLGDAWADHLVRLKEGEVS